MLDQVADYRDERVDGQLPVGIALGAIAALLGVLVAYQATTLIVLGSVWSVLIILAAVSTIDPESRKFVVGTLRKPRFTQIYDFVVKKPFTFLWRRYCTPVREDDRYRQSFGVAFRRSMRAATTTELYDTALFLAVLYPLFLLVVGQWALLGFDARLGEDLIIPAAEWGWTRVLMLVFPFAAVATYWLVRTWRFKYPNDRRLNILTATVAVLGIVIVCIGIAVMARAASIMLSAVLVVTTLSLLFVEAKSRGALALFFSASNGTLTVFIPVIAIAMGIQLNAPLVGLVSGVVVILLMNFVKPQSWIQYILLTMAVLLGLMGAASLVKEESSRATSLILFLGIFPLLNALFDFISYLTTLVFIRLGLRARLPVLWGFFDLIVACVLFLILGSAFIVAVSAMNRLAGSDLLALEPIFNGIRAAPGDYLWVYAMVFSTILPTAVHGTLSLLGLQGVVPRPIRRWIATRLEKAPTSHMNAVLAPFAVGTVWTIPFLLVGVLAWLVWSQAKAMLAAAAWRYYDLLHWLSQWAGGG